MVKVLMIAKYYYPHIGGVERHVQQLNKQLIENNFDVTLITERYNLHLKPMEIKNKIKINRFSYPKIRLLGLVFIWLKLMLYFTKEVISSDVVHIHDVFIWYLPFRVLFPKKPVYITFHGYESYPIRKAEYFQRKVAERLTRGNICVGGFMKKWYKTKPTSVTYGAVDLCKYKLRSMKKYVYDAIFSSRLDEHTGILSYLEAVKTIVDGYGNFKLVVLGDGKYRVNAQKLADVKGFVSDPSGYLGKSKVAFASRYLAILEAFALGKIVFAVYDNPIKRDYLCMTPFRRWMVVESNPEMVAQKVVDYLKYPEKYQSMIDAAYNWVRTQTWDKMAKQYLKLWGM